MDDAEAADLFGKWAAKEGLLDRITEDQCADLADLLEEVAGKVRGAMTETDEQLTVALNKIRYRRDWVAATPWRLGAEEARVVNDDMPRLLAAVDQALKLTNPFTNPTKGGTFLAAVGVQVREAMLAELTRENSP